MTKILINIDGAIVKLRAIRKNSDEIEEALADYFIGRIQKAGDDIDKACEKAQNKQTNNLSNN